ncbi:MAG: HDOD domain-containing protein [Hahellaceae bacterium]|nr:HDOD domain-containing protein [Hahellaceae bacterium]MCP5212349.1 HDOD domain-containing protein [Hahellaceae bacterium]
MADQPASVFEELRVSKLPTLPHLLVEMLHKCQSETANFQAISSVISKDAAISSRVIALANSSFYARGSRVSSLDRALMVLGTETIKTIVITASVQQFFSSFNTAHTYFLKQFWRHNLTCALLCRQFALLTSYPHPEEAYLTGLLHNIGELVLDSNYPDEFLQVLVQREEQQGLASIEYENEVFLTNHCDVGAWLVSQWHLGQFTADALKFHHAPLDSVLDAHHLVKIIYLASTFSDFGSLSQHANYEAADQLFDLSPSLTREIVSGVYEEVEKIAESLKIDIDSEVETESDKKQRIKLAEQVRDVSLLQSATLHLSSAEELSSYCKQVQESSELLFGFKNALVFLQDESTNTLRLASLDQSEDSIAITTQSERSLAASAALNRRIIFSFDQQLFSKQLPVVDQQLIRLTGASGIVCVPMIVNDRLIGVIVMGVSTPPHNASGSDRLLNLFATEVGKQLLALPGKQTKTGDEIEAKALQHRLDEILHEANNPLSIIRNYLQTLSTKLGEKHEVQTELAIIKEEIDRTGQILMRLKDLESDSVESHKKTDVNAEIRSLVQLYESSLFLTHDIQCRLRLDDHLHQQNTNRNAIRQVITNLIKNSAEALNRGGIIDIRTSGNINVNGKDYLEIIVEDNGPGIPADIMKNIFRPVSSTKGKGHSGLGLSITKNLINDLNGSVSCRSSAAGTTFQILIPDNTNR